MKFSLSLPVGNKHGDEFTSRKAMEEIAQITENAGIDAGFVTDHPAPTNFWLTHGGHDTYDPFVSLAFIAAATEKLKLHTNIIVLPYRNPIMTAKSVASLDALSDGRVLLGIAAGYLEGEFDALGVPLAGRGKAMEEAIDVMKLAWKGEPFNYDGSTFKAADSIVLPVPAHKPHPPIWMGGNSEAALRRAGEMCDGWAAFPAPKKLSDITRTAELSSNEDLAKKIAVVQEHRKAAGRTRPFDIAMTPFIDFRPHKRPSNADIVANIKELASLGVTWTVLNLPAHTRAEYRETVAWLSNDIIGAFR